MLCLSVSPQIHLPLKAFAAQITAEGLEASVFPTMSDQVWALAESFATHLALVGFLTWKGWEDGRKVKNNTAALSN